MTAVLFTRSAAVGCFHEGADDECPVRRQRTQPIEAAGRCNPNAVCTRHARYCMQ
jgi:hypothetical protein